MAEFDIKHIDLLKVDIEGAEKEVFASSAYWMSRVGAIAIELHDRFKTGCQESVDAATKEFELRRTRGETTFLLRKDSRGQTRHRGRGAAISGGWNRADEH